MEDKREEMLKKTFSENLRYFLDLRKKTRAELAAAVGVAVSTVSYWMNGVKIPRADKLAAICRFLHIDMSDLIGDVHPVQSTARWSSSPGRPPRGSVRSLRRRSWLG